MWETLILLLYFSMDIILCQASGLSLLPKKDHILLAAGDVLRLDCIHVYQGAVVNVATFSKNGVIIPMGNNKGFEILVKVSPNADSVTRTTTLEKKITSLSDSGVYSCAVQDLKVAIIVNVIQVEPVNAVLPSNSTDSVELRCEITGSTTDKDVVRWVWTFKNVILRNDDKYSIINKTNGGSLVIKRPGRNDIGKYLCSLTQKNDVKIEKPKEVYLRASPLIIDLNFEGHGENLVFKCSASGSPTPRIIWTKDGSVLNTTNYSTVDSDPNIINSSMVLINANGNDDGVYSCTAMNDIEPLNATAQLEIGREEISRLTSSAGPVYTPASAIPLCVSVMFTLMFFIC